MAGQVYIIVTTGDDDLVSALAQTAQSVQTLEQTLAGIGIAIDNVVDGLMDAVNLTQQLAQATQDYGLELERVKDMGSDDSGIANKSTSIMHGVANTTGAAQDVTSINSASSDSTTDPVTGSNVLAKALGDYVKALEQSQEEINSFDVVLVRLVHDVAGFTIALDEFRATIESANDAQSDTIDISLRLSSAKESEIAAIDAVINELNALGDSINSLVSKEEKAAAGIDELSKAEAANVDGSKKEGTESAKNEIGDFIKDILKDTVKYLIKDALKDAVKGGIKRLFSGGAEAVAGGALTAGTAAAGETLATGLTAGEAVAGGAVVGEAVMGSEAIAAIGVAVTNPIVLAIAAIPLAIYGTYKAVNYISDKIDKTKADDAKIEKDNYKISAYNSVAGRALSDLTKVALPNGSLVYQTDMSNSDFFAKRQNELHETAFQDILEQRLAAGNMSKDFVAKHSKELYSDAFNDPNNVDMLTMKKGRGGPEDTPENKQKEHLLLEFFEKEAAKFKTQDAIENANQPQKNRKPTYSATPTKDQVTGQRVTTYNITIKEMNGQKITTQQVNGTDADTKMVGEDLARLLESVLNNSQLTGD